MHVIGAGLSGLAAAVRLSEKGVPVSLYERSPQAGGRARSYHDKQLDMVIDNGNHLLLSGNWAAMSLLASIDALDSLIGPDEAVFPFIDMMTGASWTIRFNQGRWPTWVFDARARVPGSRASDYLPLALMALARGGETVADYVAAGHRLQAPLVAPLCIAVLNAEPKVASARLLAAVLRETVLKGADFCLPRIARAGLSESFAHPALRYLHKKGVDIRLGQRITAFETRAGALAALRLGEERVALADTDMAILAVAPEGARELLPELPVPEGAVPIVNLHYRLPTAPSPTWEAPFLGLVGGLAQWLFLRGSVASVTISAAEAVADWESEALAMRVWREIAPALDLPAAEMPPARVVKEKRATFLQSPANEARRPHALSPLANLMLAGDWTATGLPATIEGSVRSGYKAAEMCFAMLTQRPLPPDWANGRGGNS